MQLDHALEDLLVEWELSRRSGRERPAEELCRDCPQMLPALREHIAAVRSTDWLFDREAVPERPVDALDGVAELGEYDIGEQIGAGGMGVVYRARHRRLDRDVAVKVLPPSLFAGSRAVDRFEREVRAAGRLDHPNIVAAYDAGEANGLCYLVTKLVDGRDVSDVLATTAQLDLADACEIARQSALGLAHAHDQGIAHRDVKPSNLMVDRAGVVKILDFGVARLEEDDGEQLTGQGVVVGTVDYMSPEQFEDCRTVGPPSDVYSLGVTLYRLLSGNAPIEHPPGISSLEKYRRMAEHQAVPLAERRGDLPPALPELVDRMLSERLADRPTAAEVADALAAFAEGSDLPKLLGSVDPANVVAEETPRPMSRTRADGVSPSDAAEQIETSPERPWHRWPLVVGLLLVLGSALAFLSQFEFRTEKGVLTIDAAEGVTVERIEEAGVRLVHSKTGETYDVRIGEQPLRAGEYELQVTQKSSGLEFSARTFRIRSGDDEVVRVALLPAKPNAAVPVAEPAEQPKKSAIVDARIESLVGESDEWAWTEPELLPDGVNSEGKEHSPHLSPDGLVLWFQTFAENRARLRATRRKSVDDSFEEAATAPSPVNGRWESAPTMTADGRELVFVSIRQGGVGHMDLWSARRANGTERFGAPVNLGQEINTRGMELSPALSGDGLSLVFSSARTGTHGGTDLFECRRGSRDDPFGPPENLGPVVNTASSESGAWMSVDGLVLVFRSDRGRERGRDQLHLTTRPTRDDPFGPPRPLVAPFDQGAWNGGFAATEDWSIVVFSSQRPGGPGEANLWITRRIPRGSR